MEDQRDFLAATPRSSDQQVRRAAHGDTFRLLVDRKGRAADKDPRSPRPLGSLFIEPGDNPAQPRSSPEVITQTSLLGGAIASTAGSWSLASPVL
jgi:hypothetical protein